MKKNHTARRVGKAGAQSTRRRAEEYAKDPERARRLIDEASRKAELRKGKLTGVWESLMALIRIVRSWIDGSYREIPWSSIVLAIAALIYFVMPIDFIPDWIVALGFVDDAAVVAWVITSIKEDLEAFIVWERANPEA